jgi:alpha-galactosidase
MSVGGQRVAYGIGAHAKSIVEYDLPADAVTFRATAALDDGVLRAKEGATVRFLVFAAKPGGNLEKAGLPVAVELSELGVPATCKVRDLWARKDLGEVKGEFAPEIPWHGAGLYRISPLK